MKEKTVLVIDDSATIRRLVDNELSAAGYRVVLAGTAEDGMLKAASGQPDLILLDHQLPGTTGFDVIQQLLKDSELCCIPVVVSSTVFFELIGPVLTRLAIYRAEEIGEGDGSAEQQE